MVRSRVVALFSIVLFLGSFSRHFAYADSIKFGGEQEVRTWPMLFSPSVVYAGATYLLGYLVVDPVYRDDYFTIRAKKKYLRMLEAQCRASGECRVEGSRVIYDRLNWYFEIKIDPAVLEIVFKPSTIDELKSLRSIIQRDLFDLPATLGIRPPRFDFIGAGHIHFDIEDAFQNNSLLLRNFVVDYLNHSELYLGALCYDSSEAKDPLKDPEVELQVRKVISDFDHGLILDFKEFHEALIEAGLAKVSMTTQKPALNLKTRYKTVEIRAVRSYQSADQMVMVMNLFEQRLKHLQKNTARIPLRKDRSLLNAAQGVAQFYLYVTESGLDWKAYRQLLPRVWKKEKVKLELAFAEKPESLIESCRSLLRIFSVKKFVLGA